MQSNSEKHISFNNSVFKYLCIMLFLKLRTKQIHFLSKSYSPIFRCLLTDFLFDKLEATGVKIIYVYIIFKMVEIFYL